MSTEGEFLTPAEVAALLKLSISSVRARIRRGDLRAYRLRRSRLLRVRREDVEGLLALEVPGEARGALAGGDGAEPSDRRA
jgi:excisionase family DNA binding protein